MPKPITPSYATRRRWTEEDGRAALAAFAQSGLSLRAFAASTGLKFERLARWRRKTRSTSASAATTSAATQTVSFVEIRPRENAGERVEVVLRSGRVLRCAEEIASTALRRLVSILEEESTC